MIKYQRLKKKVLGPNSHDLFLWKRIGNWSAVIFRPNGWMGKKTGKFMHEERSGVDWTSFIIPSLTPLSCGIVLNTITIYNEEGKRWNEGNVRPNRWLENCMRLYWMPSLRRFGTYTNVNYLLLYVEYADPTQQIRCINQIRWRHTNGYPFSDLNRYRFHSLASVHL